jgi:ribosomal protein S18 acetylase RimI-like enzyme
VTIILTILTDQQVEISRKHIVGIYREAFRAAPYSKQEEEVLGFAKSLPTHIRREGFRFVAATSGSSDRLVGFAYGYTSVPGQFWHENVLKAMTVELANEWLTQSFQLVDIAVAPEAQGQGIGRRLHDCLLAELPYEKAVLSTMRAQTVAYWLYRKRGWRVLIKNVRFPGVSRPYQIMGLGLARSQDGDVMLQSCGKADTSG